MSRSVKQFNNMDTVPHALMPSKRCPRNMSAQGRHAFVVRIKGLAVRSATTGADPQVIEVAVCRRTGVLGIEIV